VEGRGAVSREEIQRKKGGVRKKEGKRGRRRVLLEGETEGTARKRDGETARGKDGETARGRDRKSEREKWRAQPEGGTEEGTSKRREGRIGREEQREGSGARRRRRKRRKPRKGQAFSFRLRRGLRPFADGFFFLW